MTVIVLPGFMVQLCRRQDAPIKERLPAATLVGRTSARPSVDEWVDAAAQMRDGVPGSAGRVSALFGLGLPRRRPCPSPRWGTARGEAPAIKSWTKARDPVDAPAGAGRFGVRPQQPQSAYRRGVRSVRYGGYVARLVTNCRLASRGGTRGDFLVLTLARVAASSEATAPPARPAGAGRAPGCHGQRRRHKRLVRRDGGTATQPHPAALPPPGTRALPAGGSTRGGESAGRVRPPLTETNSGAGIAVAIAAIPPSPSRTLRESRHDARRAKLPDVGPVRLPEPRRFRSKTGMYRRGRPPDRSRVQIGVGRRAAFTGTTRLREIIEPRLDYEARRLRALDPAGPIPPDSVMTTASTTVRGVARTTVSRELFDRLNGEAEACRRSGGRGS